MTYNFQNKSNQEKIAIILKELENGSATSPELVRETGLSQLVILHYMRHLIEIKKVYVEAYVNAPGKGFAKVYALGNRPNANKLEYLSPKYKYRPRKKRAKPFVARPDIAAQWMFNPI